ncbi:hypothetical protein [Lactococcus lactis]|uniref:hypothetical protein n=1 Tax=Lactococcus lactis TaxID=1358 RepID=UPI001F5AF41A|nr:hypothetical protein [Lactococcus lactis]
MVTFKRKGFAILIKIAVAMSIIITALAKLLKAYGKYKIDSAKAYKIKKSAYHRKR